jgi:DNA modification methylase
MGSGTVPAVARRLGRRSVGIDLNLDYAVLAKNRIGASVASSTQTVEVAT